MVEGSKSLERLAWEFALSVHGGQLYGDIMPYAVHLTAVADYFSDETLRVISLLHDTVEGARHDDRPAVVKYIASDFGERIADAVVALTRNKGEFYVEYIERVGRNSDARLVKMADLRVNLHYMTINTAYGNLRYRYTTALSRLMTIASVDSGEYAPSLDDPVPSN